MSSRPRELDFSKAAHLAARTFDGQNIRHGRVSADGAVWVRVSAQADPGTPTMQRQEAGMINARAAGWAYKLSPDKGQLLMMTRDSSVHQGGQPGGKACPSARRTDRRHRWRAAVPARSLVHAGAWREPEAGPDAPRNAAGRAGAAGPDARRPGFRPARHLPASRRAAVGRADPGREYGRMPLSRLALPPRRRVQRRSPRWWTARIWTRRRSACAAIRCASRTA